MDPCPGCGSAVVWQPEPNHHETGLVYCRACHVQPFVGLPVGTSSQEVDLRDGPDATPSTQLSCGPRWPLHWPSSPSPGIGECVPPLLPCRVRRSRRPGIADNFFDQIQVPVDVPPDDEVHVGWRFLSLPPPQFFYTQGRKPARLGGGAGGTTAILCLRETCARWHGARAANGPVPHAREAANAPPNQRRGAVVEVAARRLFCKSR